MQIQIEDLRLNCIIGILDFERIKTQEVIINLNFEYEFENSTTFIDYSKIVKQIEFIMNEEKFELLEEAILYIENYLNKTYKIKNLYLKISKPNILTNCIVSLSNKKI